MIALTEQQTEALFPRDPRAPERKAYRYARVCLESARHQLADAAHDRVLGSRFCAAVNLQQATAWLREAEMWRDEARAMRRQRMGGGA